MTKKAKVAKGSRPAKGPVAQPTTFTAGRPLCLDCGEKEEAGLVRSDCRKPLEKCESCGALTDCRRLVLKK